MALLCLCAAALCAWLAARPQDAAWKVMPHLHVGVYGCQHSLAPMLLMLDSVAIPRVSLQAITTCVNFIFSFVIGQVYLTMLCKLEFGTYIFFAFWVLVMTFYAMFFLPETKGVPIEEMGFAWRWVPSSYMSGYRFPFFFCAHLLLLCQSSIVLTQSPTSVHLAVAMGTWCCLCTTLVRAHLSSIAM